MESTSSSEEQKSSVNITTEFTKVMKDFYVDIFNTFPECKQLVSRELIVDLMENKTEEDTVVELYNYCCKVYPERFFDILYENDDIFKKEEIDSHFLPNIDFKSLWSEEISDNTRNVIWKYLQLILFSVVSSQKNSDSFGDTAKLFEAINEEDFKKKLEETVNEMNKAFNMSGEENSFEEGEGIDLNDLPNPEDLHEHITGLLDGNLGKLAKEIAEETANELNVDMEDASTVEDVFQKLFKNPGKLMGMVKKVGSKLDEKLKSGEINESELMKEASDLMKKMKTMPGMKNMNQMLGKMGLPIGKGANVNMNAFQSHMNRNIKKATQKERMLRKLEERRAARAAMEAQLQKNNVVLQTANTSEEQPQKTGKKKKRRRRKKNGKK